MRTIFARHCDYIHFNPVKLGMCTACQRMATFLVPAICAAWIYTLIGVGMVRMTVRGLASADFRTMGIAGLHPSYGIRA